MRQPAATRPAHKTIDALLAEARAGLRRLVPHEAQAALSTGALLIDIRSEVQRARDGVVPGAAFFPRSGLPIQLLSEGGAMRAIDCPCGHHFEARDDEELFRLCREHVDREHPEMRRTDEQLRERVAADAYDAQPVA